MYPFCLSMWVCRRSFLRSFAALRPQNADCVGLLKKSGTSYYLFKMICVIGYVYACALRIASEGISCTSFPLSVLHVVHVCFVGDLCDQIRSLAFLRYTERSLVLISSCSYNKLCLFFVCCFLFFVFWIILYVWMMRSGVLFCVLLRACVRQKAQWWLFFFFFCVTFRVYL